MTICTSTVGSGDVSSLRPQLDEPLMLNVAVGWWVYALTHDPFALGLVGLAVFLPAIGLALVTGHAADRFDRLAILPICYAVATLAAAGLLSYAGRGAWQVEPIYALFLLFGAWIIAALWLRWFSELRDRDQLVN